MPVSRDKLYPAVLEWATGTAASSGDNTVIAAPGTGRKLVISGLILQNESDTATTMVLKAGSTSILRFLGQTQGQALVMTLSREEELELPANTALVLNLSGNNSCGYSILYYETEA